ncbi:hypothetical protein IWZ00DRAFT_259595 [Phyllosticta capitalensis]|uniref:Uncharacterized protein n=1 Tax=Phyllosticta capitalensis TaxID=121624 RepID=A0ABR1YV71_9PEZI
MMAPGLALAPSQWWPSAPIVGRVAIKRRSFLLIGRSTTPIGGPHEDCEHGDCECGFLTDRALQGRAASAIGEGDRAGSVSFCLWFSFSPRCHRGCRSRSTHPAVAFASSRARPPPSTISICSHKQQRGWGLGREGSSGGSVVEMDSFGKSGGSWSQEASRRIRTQGSRDEWRCCHVGCRGRRRSAEPGRGWPRSESVPNDPSPGEEATACAYNGC